MAPSGARDVRAPWHARGMSKALSWKKAKPAPIVVVTGSEGLLCDRAFERIRKALAKSGQIERVDVSAVSYEPGTLITQTSPSLFAEPKLVRVTQAGSGSAAFFKDLDSYLTYPADTTTLVLMVGTGRRGKKTFDRAKENGVWVDCPEIKYDSDKAQLVREDVAAARRQITPDAVEALVRAVGDNARSLAAATSQLLADVPDDISKADVDRYHGGRAAASVFDVADAVAEGHMALALVRFREAIDSGVSPVNVVAVLASKFRSLAMLSEGIETRMSPYQRRIVTSQVRGWSDRALAGAITSIAAADAGVKGQSKDPLQAVEQCLIKCTRYKAGRI